MLWCPSLVLLPRNSRAGTICATQSWTCGGTCIDDRRMKRSWANWILAAWSDSIGYAVQLCMVWCLWCLEWWVLSEMHQWYHTFASWYYQAIGNVLSFMWPFHILPWLLLGARFEILALRMTFVGRLHTPMASQKRAFCFGLLEFAIVRNESNTKSLQDCWNINHLCLSLLNCNLRCEQHFVFVRGGKWLGRSSCILHELEMQVQCRPPLPPESRKQLQWWIATFLVERVRSIVGRGLQCWLVRKERCE